MAPKAARQAEPSPAPPADQRGELVSLNLIWDYPVSWSKYKVLRDLVQNFYDAVGHEAWQRRVSHVVEDDRLVLEATDVSFSYEWLIPIGASTKRGDASRYAGYFGEGVKMASLCALRDHRWHIEMASQDWELEVTRTELLVDGQRLSSLAYLIRRRSSRRGCTVLAIHPFHEADQTLLTTVLQSFFHAENPLFGEPLWQSAQAAIHHRSRKPKPGDYPSTYDFHGDGIVFAGYQALGSLPYPLIFSLHGHKPGDRERNNLYRMDVLRVISRCVEEVSPEAAAKLLDIFKNRWREYPEGKHDWDSWHPIVRRLVERVRASSSARQLWKAKHPDLLVVSRVKRSNLPLQNKRHEALEWLRNRGEKHRLVQDGFLALGYPRLEDVCQAAGGFSVLAEPTPEERRYVAILEEVVHRLFEEVLANGAPPPCRIIRAPRAVWVGMASCVPTQVKKTGLDGLAVRYELPYVALKARVLRRGQFHEALSTYLHEIAHMYGPDQSGAFSRAVSCLLGIAVGVADRLVAYRERWDAVTVVTE